jgi:hypothetical protein
MTQFEAFISYSQCHTSILLAYERAKRRKCQEDKGIFKHEPTSNVDYNQDIDIEFEGMEKDEADALKMMSLHGSNVPDDTWNSPRGEITTGQFQTFQETNTYGIQLKLSYLIPRRTSKKNLLMLTFQ